MSHQLRLAQLRSSVPPARPRGARARNVMARPSCTAMAPRSQRRRPPFAETGAGDDDPGTYVAPAGSVSTTDAPASASVSLGLRTRTVIAKVPPAATPAAAVCTSVGGSVHTVVPHRDIAHAA